MWLATLISVPRSVTTRAKMQFRFHCYRTPIIASCSADHALHIGDLEVFDGPGHHRFPLPVIVDCSLSLLARPVHRFVE